jgi:hypothetical protein
MLRRSEVTMARWHGLGWVLLLAAAGCGDEKSSKHIDAPHAVVQGDCTDDGTSRLILRLFPSERGCAAGDTAPDGELRLALAPKVLDGPGAYDLADATLLLEGELREDDDATPVTGGLLVLTTNDGHSIAGRVQADLDDGGHFEQEFSGTVCGSVYTDTCAQEAP